jgi:hypothetical protein
MSEGIGLGFAGAVADGEAFELGGLKVWSHSWRDTKERVEVKDPLYHQDFSFAVYEISRAGRTVEFAAGEFSNCIWGFYVRKRGV